MAGHSVSALSKQGEMLLVLKCLFLSSLSIQLRSYPMGCTTHTECVSFPLMNYFCVALMNTTAKSNFRKKGFVLAYSSKMIESIMVGIA